MNADLERWLDAATKGLPRESRGWVREELQFHYEDSVREHSARGMSAVEAHRAALAELGRAADVGGDLRETHLAERRYRIAAAASLIFPLTVLAHLLMASRGEAGINIIFYDLLLLVPMLYVLRTLHTLLALRFQLHVERRLMAVAFGLIGITLPEILMAVFYLALTLGIGGELTPLVWGVLNTLLLANLVGAVVVGLGMVWLVEALLRLKNAAILRPFCYVALINGYVLALTSAVSVAGRQDWSDFTWQMALILGVIVHALWTLMFFRAAQTPRPAMA
jgi:hypothetical protein